ncbi:hypothetical protein KFU94_02340 [Chloroflexi bacterium TSY]|nr:hypothetical protein [Chloroflexi bacterium TSY]
MNSITYGWALGGRVAARIAVVYALLSALIFYLQVSSGAGINAIWRADRLWVAEIVGTGFFAAILTPLLMLVPILLAWVAGSVGGFLTGLLTPFMTSGVTARWWGMFCFTIPSVIFHNAADLRPTLILGQHWLNSYWFWIGIPTVIGVLVGGWVGERLAGSGYEATI